MTKSATYPLPTRPLPELLEFYRQEAGQPAMVALVKAYGGQTLYLPNHSYLTDDHRLVKALGLAAAKTLCRNFGPGEIEVPLGRSHRTKVNIDIIQLADKWGAEKREFSNRDIARVLQTSERYVRMVLNAKRRPTPQLNLFE